MKLITHQCPVWSGRAKVILASGKNAKEWFKELLNRKVQGVKWCQAALSSRLI